jgi:hypothetical protein
MKSIKPMALAAALLLAAGCQSQVDTSATADSTAAKDKLGEIAGDKAMTADLMHRSYERGTFDDALALAMQDSAFAMEVMMAVKNDPRLAALLEPASTAASRSTASTAAKRITAPKVRAVTTQRTTTSRDPLDRAEQTVRKANEKIDQAARVKRDAEEAARKVDGILRPR